MIACLAPGFCMPYLHVYLHVRVLSEAVDPEQLVRGLCLPTILPPLSSRAMAV
jgi:hypothetical protein